MKSHSTKQQNQKQQFCFVKEQKAPDILDRNNLEKNKDPFFFFSYLLVGFIGLISGGYFLNHFHKVPTNTHSAYSTQESIQSFSQNVSHLIYSDSLLVRLMDGPHFRLSKVDVSLTVNNIQAKKEIKKSIQKVRNHLVFILSAQEKSTFADPDKKSLLKKKIIQQLNLFLIAGKIEKVHLKQTFLN